MTQIITEHSKFYDNTRISGYKTCPRFYQLRHQKHWRSSGTAMPLIFGQAWHSAMDAVWQHAKQYDQDTLLQVAMLNFYSAWEENGMSADLDIETLEKLGARTPMIAMEMLKNYIELRWNQLQSAELISCEQPFAVPIPGMEDVWYVGRLDKVISMNGQTIVLEHKTTTEYKIDGGFRQTYVESWDTDSQVKGYEFGGSLYFNIDQVWVDAALVHKKVHDKFRFIPVCHQQPILLEWLEDARKWITRINEDISDGYFAKNENSCTGKYGPCTFINICRTQPNPAALTEAPYGYQVDRWEPFDVLGLDKLITTEKD